MESRNMACVPTFRLIAGPVRTPEQSPQPTDLNCSKSREQFSHSIVLKIRQPMRVAPVRSSNGGPMCDKCVELDKKIEHYREITLAIGDELTIERIKALIGDLKAQKAILHPEQTQ